jgi:hypothetical protein
MAQQITLNDRIWETTTTTGTGTVTLAGAKTGYQSFNVGLGGVNGTSVTYCITDNAGNWETGFGSFFNSSGNTLARGTIIASSNANAAVSFGAGTKDVFVTLSGVVAVPPLNYISGYQMSAAGGTTTLNLAGSGQCMDVNDQWLFAHNGNIITKKLAATWAAGNGSNGLDTGSPAASTWYDVWSIRQQSTNLGDIIFTLTTNTAPSPPSGYGLGKRIGSVFADASKNVRDFVQVGDFFNWTTPVIDTNWSSASVGTAVVQTNLAFAPPKSFNVLLNAKCIKASALPSVLIFSPSQFTTAASSTNINLSVQASGATATGQLTVLMLSGSVCAVSSLAATTVSLEVVGWWDDRGKNL